MSLVDSILSRGALVHWLHAEREVLIMECGRQRVRQKAGVSGLLMDAQGESATEILEALVKTNLNKLSQSFSFV